MTAWQPFVALSALAMLVLLVRGNLNHSVLHQVFLPLVLVAAFLLKRVAAELESGDRARPMRPLLQVVAMLTFVKCCELTALSLFFWMAEVPAFASALFGETGVVVLALALFILCCTFTFGLSCLLLAISCEWGLSVVSLPRNTTAAIMLVSASATLTTLFGGRDVMGAAGYALVLGQLAFIITRLRGIAGKKTTSGADVAKQATLRRCQVAAVLYLSTTLLAMCLKLFGADRFVATAVLVLVLEIAHLFVINELFAAFGGALRTSV